MYRGTTPKLVLHLTTSIDLNELKEVWVTFESASGLKERTFTKARCTIDAEASTLTLQLTQEETLEFSAGQLKVQARVLLNDESAYASDIVTTTVNEILKDGVLSG